MSGEKFQIQIWLPSSEDHEELMKSLEKLDEEGLKRSICGPFAWDEYMARYEEGTEDEMLLDKYLSELSRADDKILDNVQAQEEPVTDQNPSELAELKPVEDENSLNVDEKHKPE